MDTKYVGVFQLPNGKWGYRISRMEGGKKKNIKCSRDENGNPFNTAKKAAMARSHALSHPKEQIIPKTFAAVFDEYCATGRKGKAYSTIRKQDSLWNQHIKDVFGARYVNKISVAEINDYLSTLYYDDGYSYRYVESFLKMFYLILGQAYSRNYLDVNTYNKMCVNKDSRIRMPKLRVDEDLDIVSFTKEQMLSLDAYFRDSNAETAYMLGKYCGLRINECYGLKWSNIDLKAGTILIDRQMQCQNGVFKLVPLKTRCAKRTLYMAKPLLMYFKTLSARERQNAKKYAAQRAQNQSFIEDVDGNFISNLELVNTLENGKRQTINSMKYHAQQIQRLFGFKFKYHFLRHTYGTLLADLNTPAHLLCNQMGHANIQVTQQYYLSVSARGIDTLRNNLEKI